MPYQRATASPEASSPTNASITTDSPPYSPALSESERPVLSSRVYSQLRRSCAIIVQETNPSGYEIDHLPDHNETLRRLQEEYSKPSKLSATQPRPLRIEPQNLFSRHHRLQPLEPHPIVAPYVHIPQNAATSFEATATRRQLSTKPKPIEEDGQAKAAPAIQAARRESQTQFTKIRAAVHTRPKTSAAACIDYTGPSVDTSKSTSRSTTTYDGFARRTSTGLSSFAVTPVHEKRTSPTNLRVSEQILQDGPSASLADASAKAWMAQELSRRREECKTGREVRPATWSSTRQKPSERPPSRSGSIAGSIADSVREGIKEYIRPRMSSDNLRSTANKSSRPSSRDGEERTGNTWWRGSLKRKGSWSSFQSSKGAQEETGSAGQDDGPNLNRALPALPGLDQYKERKPTPMHISQLMRPGREDGGKKVLEHPVAVPEDSYQHFLAQAERKKQREDSKREAEAKMRHNAIMASAKFDVRPQHTGHPQPWRTASNPPAAPVAKVVINEIPKAPVPVDKKPGLRKRLSRFWSGPEKGIDEGRKRFGSMVAAN